MILINLGDISTIQLWENKKSLVEAMTFMVKACNDFNRKWVKIYKWKKTHHFCDESQMIR